MYQTGACTDIFRSGKMIYKVDNVEKKNTVYDIKQCILRAGVIVYVEVRSGTDSCENRQAAIAHQLELLGATVTQRFTKDVTHLVRSEFVCVCGHFSHCEKC